MVITACARIQYSVLLTLAKLAGDLLSEAPSVALCKGLIATAGEPILVIDMIVLNGDNGEGVC